MSSHRIRGRPSEGQLARAVAAERWPFAGRLLQRALLAGDVRELRIALQERELELARRAVSVLGDDDLRNALALGIRVVVLVAVDEHHQVGVLFDLAALPEVREDRSLVL